MSVLLYPLFFLPIHRHTREEYYKKHEDFVERNKENISQKSGILFEQLSENSRINYEMSWFWPPWLFNDIVGYLNVGMDGGDCMTADIYLKRKWFPQKRKSKTSRACTTARSVDVKENHEFLYYCEIDKVRVGVEDNNIYLNALDGIISSVSKLLKKHNQKLNLWLPPFDFSCLNFVKAYEQAKSRR